MHQEQNNAEDQEPDNYSWPQLLKFAAVITFFASLSAFVVYFYNFNDGFANQETFGQFGDFIGGLLNPILTFFTICLLILSIRYQVKELSATREELKRSSDALEQTKVTHEANLRLLKRENIRRQIDDDYVKKINRIEDLFNLKIYEYRPSPISSSKQIEYSLNDIYELSERDPDNHFDQYILKIPNLMAHSNHYRFEGEHLNKVFDNVQVICETTHELLKYIDSMYVAGVINAEITAILDKCEYLKIITNNDRSLLLKVIEIPHDMSIREFESI